MGPAIMRPTITRLWISLSISLVPISLLWTASASSSEHADANNQSPPVASKQVAPANALFDLLVGTWDVRYEFIDRLGRDRRNQGQVSYRWILDGQALQETWTSDAQSKGPRPFGTTINFYDPKRQRWTALWVYPAQGQIVKVTGGHVNGTFVMTGHDDAGVLQRWSTSALNSDSVVGRFETSDDEGKTWRQVGTNHMKRHTN